MRDTNTIQRVLYGYVIQQYDKETGKCVDQEFYYDAVEWEDYAGEPVEEPESYEECAADMRQPDEMEEYEQQMERSSQKHLDYVLSLAKKAKVHAEPVLLRGAWHSAILSEQRSRGCDLLVMGGFRASMAKRDLIAREKQLILDEIGCAVLLVR